MKLRLLDLLVCPIDQSRLEVLKWNTEVVKLTSDEVSRIERLGSDTTMFSTEIITGVLVNRAKRIFYPIHAGIPRMLVFATRVANEFVRKHADRIARELPGFTPPGEMAAPGEQTVLRTFSSEWINYGWRDGVYWYITPEVTYKSMKFMLDVARRPVKDKLVLEVGIGIGAMAECMASTEDCELVGVDLSYSVDQAYKHFGKNRFLHIVQASAFAPPFQADAFDLVYSHGVLHHTFSTKAAFDSISKLPKVGGRLYIWVYSARNEERTLKRRILMKIEGAIRPLVSRLPEAFQTIALLPVIPLYLIHQNWYVKPRSPGFISYGWREAMHAARDRLTPYYAHRHSEEDVCSWFRQAGYIDLQRASMRERPDFVPVGFFTNTAVNGLRHNVEMAKG